jgi:Ser/Thr protein kinase RdoA (MazF antagonist)
MADIFQIAESFRIAGKPLAFKRIGSGHINDSYHVTIAQPDSPGYFLQRINHGIFKDIPSLTKNILRVTDHIANRLHSPSIDFSFSELRLVPAGNGDYYYRDPENNYWRMFNFLKGTRSYDVVPGVSLAYEGGRAFGRFQLLTSDLDAAELKETIPDFHNVSTRLASFYNVCREDKFRRIQEVAAEVKFIAERSDKMNEFFRMAMNGQLPSRVTHNDTKFNNILFDNSDRAVCIVDLDTVMPGLIHYDFGDAIRTGASTGAEDEADLQKVNIDLELFRAYSQGYLEVSRDFLTTAETAYLAFSARLMTFIIGLRFLTDHIAGDVYYKTLFPGHNLRRARAQFRLVRSMEENAPAMEKIISDLCK